MKTGSEPVQRAEILDLEAYERERPAFRQEVMELKNRRRVHLGEFLTFLFENRDTVRYQVQEMLRIEKRSAEEDIQHELSTYNELLGNPGGLGCTLLIEIGDPAQRDKKLRQWLALCEHVYLELSDGSRAAALYDERQLGDDRLSSVQYLKFDCGGSLPVAVACDLPGLELRAELTPVQRRALVEDLGSA